MDAFWAAPPVSRTITAAVAVTSVAVHALKLLPIQYLAFVTPWVFGRFPPELWRLVTAFLVSGPQLGVIMDPYFLYMMTNMLETGPAKFRRKGELFMYLVFVCSVIVAASGVYLGGVLFLQALILALTHTAAQHNPSAKISFFIIRVDMTVAPYVMLAMTVLMAGPDAALNQATGILASHLYDFLTRIWPEFGGSGARNLIPTPAFVSKIFGDDDAPQGAQNTGFGYSFQARPQGAQAGANPPAAQQSGSSWTSGSAWGTRGQGRRLGGD